MFATLLPLFNEDLSVRAYLLYAQKENHLEQPALEGTGSRDGAANIPGIEVLQSVSPDTLAAGAEIIVPVTEISLFTDLAAQCPKPLNRIVLLMDTSVKSDAVFKARLHELHQQGFKLAFRNLPISQFEEYRPMLDIYEYIFLDYKRVDITKLSIYFSKLLPNIKLCAVNVGSTQDFERLKKTGGYEMYEGSFYRIPAVTDNNEVSPLKANYIELLNVINTPDFDLTKAADVIGRDPALVISLLSIVNRMTVNSEITSIRQATALLGQRELKRWINTVVIQNLCMDRPSEIMRLAMIRAKFAENLAPIYEKAIMASELFIMGLFSVLDYILDMPMEEALKTVTVSKQVYSALVDNEGDFSGVLSFVKAYEQANWQEVSRLVVVNNIDMDAIYKSYTDALKWYSDMFM